LDNLEKQAKTNPSPATTTGRKTNRGRPSSSPEKKISLRQQPIDASDNIQHANVYEDMDTVTETKESAGRKRKSITPVSTVNTKKRFVKIKYFDQITSKR
jgi:hypothetical protein